MSPSTRIVILLCYLPFFSAAVPCTVVPAIKESIHAPGRLWTKIGSPPPDHILNLRIALPQSDYTTLEQHLYEISNPDSPSYGSFLTKEQVEGFVQPKSESVAAVEDWLEDHGIDTSRSLQRSPAGDWLKVAMPVALAEEMLSTVSRSAKVQQ